MVHEKRFGAKVRTAQELKSVTLCPLNMPFAIISHPSSLIKDPRVACPTCATTYSLQTGGFGPELKREGLAGFVSTWAKTATINNASQDVTAYVITMDAETGQVFCRER
jgi:hypothetical protein